MRNRYEKYKDSGVDWIGEVPEHWEVCRLGYLLKRNDGGVWGDDFDDKGAIVLRSTEIMLNGEWKIESPAKRKLNTREYNNSILKEGDLLLTKSSGSEQHIGKTAIVNKKIGDLKCAFSNFMQRLRTTNNLHPKYLYYFLNANGRDQMFYLSTTTTGLKNLSGTIINNVKIQNPNYMEQRAIIDFLDQKTSEIDSLIADKEKLIQRLQDYKQSVITEAVTKGLNLNVKMKDSGVEWIGEVPEHWEVVKLNFLKKKPFLYGANETPDDFDPDLPRYIRITDINADGKLREDTVRSLSWEKARHYILEEGDILFARSGATVGKTFIYKDVAHKACFAGYLIKYSSNEKKISPQFVYYFTLSSSYSFWVVFNTIQATIQNVSAEKYGNLSIPVPPMKEQELIIEHLNSKLTNVNDLIRVIQLQITKINEYRQLLIFEVVTGKLRIN